MAKPLVLVVDDSHDDLMLMRMAVGKSIFPVELRTLDSGAEAIGYLKGEGKYADRSAHPRPRLAIVDLKMPKVSGFDVLEAVGKSSDCPPCVVMSASGLAADMQKATELGAATYEIKPAGFSDLCQLMNRLILFFCSSSVSFAQSAQDSAPEIRSAAA